MRFRNIAAVFVVCAIAMMTLSSRGVAASTGQTEAGEQSIFFGEGEGYTVEVIAVGGEVGEGQALRFQLRTPIGGMVYLQDTVDREPSFAVGGVAPLSGGGYAHMRLRDKQTSYIVFSGIGKWLEGSDAVVDVAGLVIEENGVVTNVVNMSGGYDSELGPEAFERLDLPRDIVDFSSPQELLGSGTPSLDKAFGALCGVVADEMMEMESRGAKAAIVYTGRQTVDGNDCLAFSFGENADDVFTAKMRYAVDGRERVYRMDVGGGEDWAMLDTPRE